MPDQRFDQLSDKTKKFLADLREEDVELLGEGIALVRSVRTVGKFVKWLIVGVIGIVVGGAGLWESVNKIIALMRGIK